MAAADTSAPECWQLRPELEFTDGVDSWNVREAPSYDAPVLAVLRAGAYFALLGGREGDWLQVRLDSGAVGWTCQKFGELPAFSKVRGAFEGLPQVPQPAPAATPTQPPQLLRRISQQKNLGELRERRQALDEAIASKDDVLRARAAAEVQATMAKLELLGIPNDQLLNLEGADALLHTETVMDSLLVELGRTTSFAHSDFANPADETCWLSTFFQCLWHSRVFHAAFDRLVRPLPALPEGSALRALRETWEQYERAMNSGQQVSVRALASAWGGGRGDCAEAFGKLQNCRDDDLKTLADLFAMVPVPVLDRAPSVEELWCSVREQGVQESPLLALDLALPRGMNTSAILRLALDLVPAERRPANIADLGAEHRLVAVVCYMQALEHYVVFCRCISDADCWLFFNDIPGVASRAQREVRGWAAVAHECARFELCPRLLLYESPAAAERAIKRAGLRYYFSVVRRHVPAGMRGVLAPREGWLMNAALHGFVVLAIAVMVRLLFFT